MVHHNEDIFVPSSTLLQMKEVSGDKFKRRGSHNGIEWGSSLKRGGLLFNALTDMSNMVFNISLHVGPIEVLSGEVYCAVHLKMTQVFVEFLEDT